MSPTLTISLHTIRARTALLVLLAALLMALLPAPMHAQSMDYGSLEQLFREPVTTSVDGSPQRQSDVPATMEIITAEEIRRSGAKDIPGVLSHVGGVDTLEWGNDNTDVSVRGYDEAFASRLLVLVDGRQVYADYFGYTPWSSVAVELGAIRQIEIVKGPSGALFGFNAVGGVINIVTYNPLYDNVKSVTLTGGTQKLAAGSAVDTFKIGARAAVRLSVGGYSDSDFSTPVPAAEAAALRKNEDRGVINIDSVFRLNDKTILDIEASHATAKLNEMGPVYSFDNAQYGTDSVKVRLIAESRLGLLQATVYTNWLRYTYAQSELDQLSSFNNRLTVAQFQDIFKRGANHTLRAAVEYRNSTESTTPTTGATVYYDVFAASGMWNWQITPTIALTNALRLDHQALGRVGFLPPGYPFTNSDFNRTLTSPNFNSGLVWKPSETDSLRFMVSRGTQLPSLDKDGDYLLLSPSGNISGTPFLKPAVVTNYELGWDHTHPAARLLFRASAFHQRSVDLLSLAGGYIPTTTGPYFLSSNVGGSEANGLELEFKGRLLQNYRWGVNYSPEWISDHFIPNSQEGAAYIDYDDTTPVHVVKANLGWTNGKWVLDTYLQYHSATHGLIPTVTATTLVPVGGFSSFDGRVAYNLTERFTWAVSGQNLTHSSQVQTSGPAVERRVLGTLSFTF